MRREHAKFRGMIGNILLKSLDQERVDHFGSIVRRAFLESRVKLQAVARDAVFGIGHGKHVRAAGVHRRRNPGLRYGHILRLR